MKLITLLFTLLFNLSVNASFHNIKNFGNNPGELEMVVYTPKSAKENSPLIVLVHGCIQSSQEYATKSGWKDLAIKYGLKLLLPQQADTNNSYKCYNWFYPEDFQKGQGESKSIREMIDWVKKNDSVDTERIFISGLSAGAAMANALLANYPHVFKSGSIIAGVPYGCATGVSSAWMCMYGMQFPPDTPRTRGQKIRKINPDFSGPWPNILVIHGTSDDIVAYNNGLYLVAQWANVHGVNLHSNESSMINEHTYTNYGRGRIGFLSILNQKHGQPIAPDKGCGAKGKYFIDSGVCAAYESLKFFGIANLEN